MSTAHRPASPSRHALALLALFAALPPTLRADDCISDPAEGIFCSGDENPDYETINVSGAQSATWTPASMVPGRTYYYTLQTGSSLSVTAAADDYFQAKVMVSGTGGFHLVGGRLRVYSFGGLFGNIHVTNSRLAASLYDNGGNWQPGSAFHLSDATLRLERGIGWGGYNQLANPFVLSGDARLEIIAPEFYNPADLTVASSGVISGSGSLIKTGPGLLRLEAANTHAGGTRISEGNLEVFNDANFGAADAPVTFDADTGLWLNGGFVSSSRATTLAAGSAYLGVRSGSATWNGVISGDGALIKTGAGTLTLSAANTYSGGTTVAAGALSIASDANLGAADSSLTLGNDTTLTATAGFSSSARPLVLSGSTGKINIPGAAHTLTWNGATSGSGKLVKQGAGTLVLAGGTGHGGGAQLDAGTLEVSVAATLGGTGLTSWSGPVTGSGALVKSGAGTLQLSGAATHSGYTTVLAGTLRTTAANVLSPASALFLIGGSVLDLDGHDQTVGDLDSWDFAASATSPGTVKLGGATLTNLNRVTNNWAGAITGDGTFIKKGAATMNWTGANTFTGTLQIDAGKVSAQAANVFSPNAAVALASGTTLQLDNHAQTIAGLSGSGGVALGSAALAINQAGDSGFSGVISGTGSLTKSGSGVLALSGDNTFSGGLAITGGLLSVAKDGALGASDARIDLNGGSLRATGTFTTDRAATVGAAGGGFDIASETTFTWAGAIDGSGPLAKTGPGTLVLTGDSSAFSGDTSVAAGTLSLRGALGSGSFAIASGATLDLRSPSIGLARISGAGSVTGTADFLSTSSSDLAVEAVLAGSGTLLHSGAGVLTLSGENHYTGGTSISDGVISVAADSALGAASGGLSFDGGTLETTGALASARAVALVGNGTFRTVADTELSGVVSGPGALTKTGAAALALSSANTYSGGTTVSAGTLRAGHAAAFGSGTVTTNGGTLDLAGFAVTNAISNRGGTLTGLANYAGSQTIHGAASFSGSVGGAIEIVSAASLDTTGATFTGPVTVQSGATLSGTGTLGTVTIAAGGLLSPGNSPGLLTLGAESILSGTTLIELGGLDRGTGYDAIDVRTSGGELASITIGGTLDVVFWGGWTPDGAASFQIFQASSFGGTFAQINLPALAAGYEWRTDRLLASGYLDLVASAIPEPASAATLAGLALLGFAATRRRRLARRD